VFAPHAFLGSIPTQSVAHAASNVPTDHSSRASILTPLLGSKPEDIAQSSTEARDRNVDWVQVVDAVNMRSGASSAGSVIKVQPEGTRLRVVSRDGNWIQVVEPESELQGWVYETYVRSVAPTPQRARVADARMD
jgi:uncharacterized protein YgiM (DUF1202 family)